MGIITKPDFEDLSSSSEFVHDYLSEESDAVPTDLGRAIIGTYEDLRSTMGERQFRHDITMVTAYHTKDLRDTLHPNTSLDEFLAAAVPNPLSPAPTPPVQFNRRSSMRNGSLSSLSVRRANSQRSVSVRYSPRKSDSVIDPDTPTKRHSSASFSPSLLRHQFQGFDGSNDEQPTTPTKDPRRNSRASLATQMEEFEEFGLRTSARNSAYGESKDMVSDEHSRMEHPGIQAALQRYATEEGSKQPAGSYYPEIASVDPNPTQITSTALVTRIPTPPLSNPHEEHDRSYRKYLPKGYKDDNTHFGPVSDFSEEQSNRFKKQIEAASEMDKHIFNTNRKNWDPLTKYDENGLPIKATGPSWHPFQPSAIGGAVNPQDLPSRSIAPSSSIAPSTPTSGLRRASSTLVRIGAVSFPEHNA